MEHFKYRFSDEDCALLESYDDQFQTFITHILHRLSSKRPIINEEVRHWASSWSFDSHQNPLCCYSAHGDMWSDLKSLRDRFARNRMHRIRLFPLGGKVDCLWQSIPYPFLVDEDINDVAIKLDTIILSLNCSLETLIDMKATRTNRFSAEYFKALRSNITNDTDNCIFSNLFHKINTMIGAQLIIARAWRKAISDPTFRICRKRLLREFDSIVDSNQ